MCHLQSRNLSLMFSARVQSPAVCLWRVRIQCIKPLNSVMKQWPLTPGETLSVLETRNQIIVLYSRLSSSVYSSVITIANYINRMRQTAASPVSSCVSMKSNESIGQPPDLSNGTVTSDPVWVYICSESWWNVMDLSFMFTRFVFKGITWSKIWIHGSYTNNCEFAR